MSIFSIGILGEPLRAPYAHCRTRGATWCAGALASGYPLHHLRGFHPLGGSAAIPLANAPLRGAGIGGFAASCIKYARIKYLIMRIRV
jgi:hypothetical protein